MNKYILSIVNSIQAKLIGLFLLSALFAIAIVLIFNQSLLNLALASADITLEVNAKTLAGQIDEFNERNIQSFAIAANLPSLVEFFAMDEQQRQDENVRENVKDTLGTLQIRPYNQFNVLSYALLDLEGNNLIDTFPAYSGLNESNTDYFESPLISGTPYISTIKFEPHRGNAFFYYSVPIRQNIPSSPIVGILRAQISVSAMQNILLAADTTNDTHLVLIDENFLRLFDSENPDQLFRAIREYSMNDVAMLQAAQQLPPIPANQLSSPLPNIVSQLSTIDDSIIINGSLNTDTADGQRIAIVPLETQPWYLLYARPSDEFFAPVVQQTQGILLLSAVLMIAAAIVAFVFSRTLSQPLQSLTAIAKMASKGDLDVQADIQSDDEVGTLAQTFNQMINELKISRMNLEDRVVERTQELTLTNQALQREIEERKRLEETNIHLALEGERGRILMNFIQDVSHEFKTPLSIINVQSHLIMRLVDDPIVPRVDQIVAQSKSIETLVNQMVMMSRLDNVDEFYKTELIYLDEFIDSVYISELEDFKESELSLTIDLDAPDCYVEANSQLLFYSLQHILNNALRFTPKNGKVTMQTNCDDTGAQIVITDNGIGISEADLERVFERFFRADIARTERGFGLGLALAKRIIELFGGNIELRSTLDEGTTVEVTIPRKL